MSEEAIITLFCGLCIAIAVVGGLIWWLEMRGEKLDRTDH